MTAGLITLAMSVCAFAGGAAGLLLNRVLAGHHFTKEATDAVRLGTSMLSILAALVLGFLIATARDSLETADRIVRGVSVNLIDVDQTLGAYGPETSPIRDLLRRYAEAMLRDGWARSDHDLLEQGLPPGVALERVRLALLSLEPADARQHWLRDQALTGSGALLRARWELLERRDLPIRPAFLVVLTSWVTFILAGFGLNAPRNAVVVGTLAVCAYAFGTSVFLVLEMEAPFDGFIQITSDPIKVALTRMGR
ncbi:bestrophin-like domain [Sabulicella glaciei]|uniref:DUF4239 domain-containing protein n=1 Tax=Sabulicella glaciei TaxID=2984948 RepID=A0ABT3NSY0_9PROT|nr:hypothetical protein [Roseococcus sp. MDT2-1-1]MCW8085273.1 hypothetical protein [Roseococcus sp. MDT2-1-1]